MLKRISAVLAVALWCGCWAFAADKYVTQSGAGSHDGSLGNEWSVAEFNAASISAGQTVDFEGNLTSQIVIPSGGSSGNRITYDFSGASVNTSSDPRIVSSGKSHINIINGTASSTTTATLISSNSTAANNITISGWTWAAGSSSTGVFVFTHAWTDFIVESNTVSGILAFVNHEADTSNVTIRNNSVISTTACGDDSCQVDIIRLPCATTVMIQGNYLKNLSPGAATSNHADIVQTHGVGCTDPADWTIRYNWIELGEAAGSSNNAWLQFENIGGYFKIYANVLTSTEGSGSNASLGLETHNQNSDLIYYFYNNVVIRRDGAPYQTLRMSNTFTSVGTLYSKNNIIWVDVEGDSVVRWSMTEGDDWNYNFIYHWDACSSTQSGANGSCSTDPQFEDIDTNDVRLSAGSPLIGAGVALDSEYNHGPIPGATWPNPELATRSDWDPGVFVMDAAPAGNGALKVLVRP